MAEYRAPESGIDEKKEPSQEDTAIGTVHPLAHHAHQAINASGHRDQLDRNYGILSICGMALTVDNAWVAIGTSLNVAICEFCRATRRKLLRALTFSRRQRRASWSSIRIPCCVFVLLLHCSVTR